MMASRATRDERWQFSPTICKSLVAIFILALIVRGTVSTIFLADLRDDPDAYRTIAQTLRHSSVFGMTSPSGLAKPIAFRPPLYPFVLAWTTSEIVPVAILHTILGAGTAAMVFLSSIAFTRQLLVGWVAAAMVTIDPILVQQSTVVMTETLAVAIVSAVLWQIAVASQRGFSIGRSLLVGVLLSLAYLCRPTFLVWAILIVVGLVWAGSRPIVGRKVTWRTMRPAIIVSLALMITMAAWMTRNAISIGHPVWATTHGGYTLLLANNPMFYDHLRGPDRSRVWNPDTFFDAYQHRYDGDPTTQRFWEQDWRTAGKPQFPSDASEVSDDRRSGAAATALIRREPAMFVRSCFSRLWRMWKPFPNVTSDRSSRKTMVIGAYCLVFNAMVILGAWRLRKCEIPMQSAFVWSILSMVLALSMVHAVYWSNVRMRAPAIPGLAIIAACCLCRQRSTPRRSECLCGPHLMV